MLEGIKITIKANNSSDIDLVNNKSIKRYSETCLWWIHAYNKVRFKTASLKSYCNDFDKIIGLFKHFPVIVFHVLVYSEEWADLSGRVYEVTLISYAHKAHQCYLIFLLLFVKVPNFLVYRDSREKIRPSGRFTGITGMPRTSEWVGKKITNEIT